MGCAPITAFREVARLNGRKYPVNFPIIRNGNEHIASYSTADSVVFKNKNVAPNPSDFLYKIFTAVLNVFKK